VTIRIGLTGPIGCGKSTVGRWLEERGAVLVDADAVAREVTAPGTPGHDAVLARFGAAVRAADGTLDRAALARIVFADADRLRDLEAIVHPVVRPALLGRIDEAQRAGAAVVVVEAIRLVEGGLASACDEVWLVTCAPGDQRRRLRQRGMETTDALRRIEAQAGLEERLRPVASRVIDTSGSPAAARARVDAALDAALAAVRE
jgi:dephospho-CoA kinase